MAKPEGWNRTAELVKTFKVLNDPNGPQFSIRFVGGIAAFAIMLAGAGAIVWASQEEAASPQVMSATLNENADGTRTDYVGLVLSAASAPAQTDARALEDAMAQWEREHAGATVVSKEAVFREGQLVGWQVTYRP